MQKKDTSTLIGIIAGLVLIVASIIVAGGVAGAGVFIDIPSIIIVFGGMIVALMVSFPLNALKKTGVLIKQTMSAKEYDMLGLVNDFVRISTAARREGLLALEDQMDDLQDNFIKKGITLAVDGTEQDTLREILNAEIEALEERHGRNRAIFDKAGELAPAWGMIGTLIGLVLMLNNLSDPSSLGPSMAVAMITTFYGSVLANLIFIPMSTKLAQKTEKEVSVKLIMVEGIIGITTGINPKVLEEKLLSYLSPEERDSQKKGEMNDESKEKTRAA